MKLIESVIREVPIVSVISKIEVLGYPMNKEIEEIFKSFFIDAHVLPITDEIIDRTIELSKIFKIKLPDALIAATALNNNLVLISRNIK